MARLSFSLAATFSVDAGIRQPYILYRSPTDHRVALLAIGFGCSSAVYGDDGPGLVEFVEVATGGGNPLTPAKLDDSLTETPKGLSLRHTSPEGVEVAVLRGYAMHPQAYTFRSYDRHDETVLSGFASTILRATFPQAITGNAYLEFEE